jgi:hypothetical protein
MRTFVLPLLALLLPISLLSQENRSPSDVTAPDGLTIPVELTKSIKADKAQPGDAVQLQMAEAILAGNGLVVPAKARLSGRILSAGSKDGDRPSFLSLLVERVEWSGHVLRLHAFVSGWGMKRVFDKAADCVLQMKPVPRGSPNAFVTICNSRSGEHYEPAHWSHKQLMGEISIQRNQANDSSVLSSKKNIRLPRGLLLMLQNVNPTKPQPAQ